MKKISMLSSIIALLMLILLAASLPACAESGSERAENEYDPATQTTGILSLPASLRVIDEEAFEGTAATAVVGHDRITGVKDHAFANMKQLETVILSRPILFVGDGVFSNCENVTIYLTDGNTAKAYTRNNRIRFTEYSCIPQAVSPANGDHIRKLIFAYFIMLYSGVFLYLRPARKWRREIQAMIRKKRIMLHTLDLCFP